MALVTDMELPALDVMDPSLREIGRAHV